MRLYELVLVLKTSLSDTQRKKLLDGVKTWLQETKIAKENVLGQKVLSYPIKKEQAGYFIAFALESEKSVPLDFEKRIIANEDILRHLLVRTK